FGSIIRRGWENYLDKIFNLEKDIDIVFLLGATHLAKGIPTWINRKFGVSTVYYETDIQNIPKYSLDHKPDEHEFPDYTDCDAVICSFEKTSQEFREYGIEKVWTVPFGADPMIFHPTKVNKDTDVFFSGYGAQDREDWMRHMITIPSKALSNSRFVVEGSFDIDLGNAERTRSIALDNYINLCRKSKINLNILRQQFIDANVLNSRIFELASLECCIVSNPCKSLNKFLKPKKEIIVVNNDSEAVEMYNWLLSSEEDRVQIARSARQRIIREHTYLHRANEFLDIFKRLI
ncbi:glycosyltransferase, partial [Candidatus Pacearchaeota archaeon]|nr:glycosyltransferase [Candidatus Pacearchaeota archaeon]